MVKMAVCPRIIAEPLNADLDLNLRLWTICHLSLFILSYFCLACLCCWCLISICSLSLQGSGYKRRGLCHLLVILSSSGVEDQLLLSWSQDDGSCLSCQDWRVAHLSPMARESLRKKTQWENLGGLFRKQEVTWEVFKVGGNFCQSDGKLWPWQSGLLEEDLSLFCTII